MHIIRFLKRNRTKNPGVREAAYKTLLRPQVEYASTVWSPGSIERPQTTQNRPKPPQTSPKHPNHPQFYLKPTQYHQLPPPNIYQITLNASLILFITKTHQEPNYQYLTILSHTGENPQKTPNHPRNTPNPHDTTNKHHFACVKSL